MCVCNVHAFTLLANMIHIWHTPTRFPENAYSNSMDSQDNHGELATKTFEHLCNNCIKPRGFRRKKTEHAQITHRRMTEHIQINYRTPTEYLQIIYTKPTEQSRITTSHLRKTYKSHTQNPVDIENYQQTHHQSFAGCNLSRPS